MSRRKTSNGCRKPAAQATLYDASITVPKTQQQMVLAPGTKFSRTWTIGSDRLSYADIDYVLQALITNKSATCSSSVPNWKLRTDALEYRRHSQQRAWDVVGTHDDSHGCETKLDFAGWKPCGVGENLARKIDNMQVLPSRAVLAIEPGTLHLATVHPEHTYTRIGERSWSHAESPTTMSTFS